MIHPKGPMGVYTAPRRRPVRPTEDRNSNSEQDAGKAERWRALEHGEDQDYERPDIRDA